MARKLIVEIIGDTSSLEKSFRKTEAASKKLDKEVGQTARGAVVGSGAFTSMGRSVAFASGAFLGGAGLVAGLKASVGAASNLAEQTSKSNVVFGQSASAVKSWSTTTVNSMGLASDQALETASSFGALLRPLGLTGTEAAAQSQKLTKLGADLASFYNTSVQDALDSIRSGLVGEAEPLRKYGVLLSETRVQQEALRETGKKHAAQLTQQEKVLARVALIYKDTSQAQGDFTRTSGGFANQQRILTANLRQLEIEVGQKLIPVLTDATKKTNRLIGAIEKLRQKPGGDKGLIDIIPFGHVSAIDLLGDSVVRLAKGLKSAVFEAGRLSKVQLSPEQIRLLGLSLPPVTGEDISHGAAGARTNVFPGAAHPRASLTFQLSLLQERLAIAEGTATQKDDRAVLVRIAALTKQKIAKTKELGARTKLREDLVSVEGQIDQIDKQRASDKKSAHDKELAARAKELAADKAAYAKTKAQAEKLLAQFKKNREALKAAAQSVRDAIGDIFTGPVFTSPAGVLGIQNARAVNAPVTATGFVANLRAQTSQFVKLNNDLASLARRGAPAALIKQLREGGAEQAPLIHQLATAGRPTLRSLFRAFAQQEKVVQQIAHADVQAKTVTIVTGHLGTSATTPASQRRGRQAGVPSTIGSFINP